MKEKIVIPVSERGIEARLINWGLCKRGRSGGSMRAKETRRSSYGGGGYRCMTNVVCNLMRDAAQGPRGGATAQAKLDFEDADKINRAWSQLSFRHVLLVKNFYWLGHSVNAICRNLGIKQWPAIHWERELQAAQDAIEDLVRSGNK